MGLLMPNPTEAKLSDAIESGGEGPVCWELIEMDERREEGFLGQVGRQLGVASAEPQVAQEKRLVASNEGGPCGARTGLSGDDELLIGRESHGLPPSPLMERARWVDDNTVALIAPEGGRDGKTSTKIRRP